MSTVKRIKTISEFHRLRSLPKPEHPLISVVDYSAIQRTPEMSSISWVLDFYQISIKRGMAAKLKYGQQEYDFDEGVMFFIAPNQVFRIEADPEPSTPRSGWMLLIHPDFLWNTTLARGIKQYEYFDYSVAEALFLSDKEETVINIIIETIRQEYHANMDRFSQGIIISQLETLLGYAERFYHRQFITRKISNHAILDRLEAVLTDYFRQDELLKSGLPTVYYLAEVLHISPKYLSSLLKVLTGQTAQQHIHEKLIERAKEQLSTTDLSIGEIAFALGFEHQQSFSKLFKTKTQLTPLAFRQSFTAN
ncbi:AraC family transcriptional regulator [Larkinella harenae]